MGAHQNILQDKQVNKIITSLYDAGFNIVPVDRDKRPLVSWSSKKRIEREKLVEVLDKATGIAIVGGQENPFKTINTYLMIVDVDKPSVLDRYPFLKSAINKTVRWATGPRCPRCEAKHLDVLEPGKRFRCSKCGAEFSLSEARRGLGALFWISIEDYEKYFKGTRRLGDVEFLINNYQLIPPSIHPTGVRYEWIKPINLTEPNFNIYRLSDTEIENIVAELGLVRPEEERVEESSREVERLRELSDSDLIKLKELIKEAYKPGYRQNLVLYLSGWLVKARVSPVSTVRLVKMLYDETDDEDSIKTRLSAVVYSYKKAGIDVDAYAEQIEGLTGVTPYGLEREIREEEVKGKTGVQEILEEVLGEERALATLKGIEDILGSASPFRDSIIELLDYERQLYAIANLKALVMVRARLDGDRFQYKERIAVVAPTKITVYANPIGGITKYEITFEGKTRPRPLTIGPATIDEIADRLRAEGLVYHSKLLGDVLNAIIQGAIKRGRAEIKEEIEAPGF